MITIKEIQKMLIQINKDMYKEKKGLEKDSVTSYRNGFSEGYNVCLDVYKSHIDSICGIIQMWLDQDGKKEQTK